jgi:DNA-binding NarL/FixJ family response regulator
MGLRDSRVRTMRPEAISLPVSSEPRAQRLGVILAEAPNVVRAGISLLVSSQPDLEVVIETSRAEEALESVRNLRSKKNMVALIGLGLTGERDGLWLIRSVRELFPTLPVLACGSEAEDSMVSRALFMGADGFVHKDVEPAEFVDAIRGTARGEVVLAGVSPTALGRIAERLEHQVSPDQVLTDRELEVLVVAGEGLTAREIGDRLGVRERTVTTHLTRIYRKLGTRSRVGAIAAATHAGFLAAGTR